MSHHQQIMKSTIRNKMTIRSSRAAAILKTAVITESLIAMTGIADNPELIACVDS